MGIIKSAELNIRIHRLEFRRADLTLKKRIDYISDRLNSIETSAIYRSKEGQKIVEQRHTDMHDIRITHIKGGDILAPDSLFWKSKYFGLHDLDLKITGLAPRSRELTSATYIEIVKERLAGLGGPIPRFIEDEPLIINVLQNAQVIGSQKR